MTGGTRPRGWYCRVSREVQSWVSRFSAVGLGFQRVPRVPPRLFSGITPKRQQRWLHALCALQSACIAVNSPKDDTVEFVKRTNALLAGAAMPPLPALTASDAQIPPGRAIAERQERVRSYRCRRSFGSNGAWRERRQVARSVRWQRRQGGGAATSRRCRRGHVEAKGEPTSREVVFSPFSCSPALSVATKARISLASVHSDHIARTSCRGKHRKNKRKKSPESILLVFCGDPAHPSPHRVPRSSETCIATNDVVPRNRATTSVVFTFLARFLSGCPRSNHSFPECCKGTT